MIVWWCNMNQSIIEACNTLRLPSISQNYQAIADRCSRDNVSHTEFLNKLFECELQHRD